MKKYLKLLPVIIYPYAYIIWFHMNQCNWLCDKDEKENVLSTSAAVLSGICSFLYCIDIVFAIMLVRMSKEKKNI